MTFPGKVFDHFEYADTNLEYQIYPLAPDTSKSRKASNFIIKAEQFGIPQARHRVILLVVKKGFSNKHPTSLKKKNNQVTVKNILGNLPRIRSGLSRKKKRNDTLALWIEKIMEITYMKWFDNGYDQDLVGSIKDMLVKTCQNKLDQGNEYCPASAKSFNNSEIADWYNDEKLSGVCNHVSKSHMVSDLHRYIYMQLLLLRNIGDHH